MVVEDPFSEEGLDEEEEEEELAVPQEGLVYAYKYDGKYEVLSEKYAEVVANSLLADKELSARVQKTIHVEGNAVCVSLKATELKLLKSSLNAFQEHFFLSCKLVETFGGQEPGQ